MKKQFTTLAFFTAITLTLSSCSSTETLKKQVAGNPDIIFNAIEENPERFMQVVQAAAQKAHEQAEVNYKQAQARELNEAIKNPLKPEIQKDEAVLGPQDAPITLVTYSDFECPYCSRGSVAVNSLLQKYKGQIRFVYKHLPLSFHQSAMMAAKYFEAIKMQSPKKAFSFHDKVYANQSKLKDGEKFLKVIARKVGADMKQIAKAINSKEVTNTIERHQEEAQKFNMQGTPGFILNGVPVRGAYPAEHFVAIIEKLQQEGKLTI